MLQIAARVLSPRSEMDFLLQGLAILFFGFALFFYVRLSGRVYLGHAGKVSGQKFSRVDLAITLLLVAFIAYRLMVSAGVTQQAIPAGYDTRLLALYAGLQYLVILLPILTLLLGRGVRLSELFGFNQVPLLRVVLLGTGLLVLSIPIVYGASSLMSVWMKVDPKTDSQEIIQIFQQAKQFSQRLPIIILAVLVAPVSEEFIFRGYLYGVLKRYGGGLASLFFTSVLFALLHLNVPALLPLFLLACTFTLAYEMTGSLLVPMTMHALFNALNIVAILYFGQ